MSRVDVECTRKTANPLTSYGILIPNRTLHDVDPLALGAKVIKGVEPIITMQMGLNSQVVAPFTMALESSTESCSPHSQTETMRTEFHTRRFSRDLDQILSFVFVSSQISKR